MKRFTSKTQKTGKLGEEICAKWLKNNNYKIIERNYTTRSGEIDIIAEKTNIIYFIEVKSVSCENTNNISRETTYNPAENVTREKIKRFQKTMFKYIEDHNVSYETQFDVYLVYIDKRNVKHKIERIQNIS